MNWFLFFVGFLIAAGPWLVARLHASVLDRRARLRRNEPTAVAIGNGKTAYLHPGDTVNGVLYTGGGVLPRPTIPREVQEEIDQTPAWWDREFHKLLAATGAYLLEYGEVEYIEDRTLAGPTTWYALPRPVAYLSCICQDCKRTRMMGCDPRD